MTWFLHICALVFVPAWQMSVDTVRMIELIPLWVRIIAGADLFIVCLIITKERLMRRPGRPILSLTISAVVAASMMCPWILVPPLMVFAPIMFLLVKAIPTIDSRFIHIMMIVYPIYLAGWLAGRFLRKQHEK